MLWLAGLAYVMNLALEKIGCALGVSETVMGLTLGAMGTSFPNLYASVLTARAGQASMSLCQAFGSNTFNLCICLGFVWLLQTGLGSCSLGRGGNILTPRTNQGPCDGCYMPMGLKPMCPYAYGQSPKQEAGSLQGAGCKSTKQKPSSCCTLPCAQRAFVTCIVLPQPCPFSRV